MLLVGGKILYKGGVQGTYRRSVVCQTIEPDEVKIVLELFLGLVLFGLYFLEHSLEIHRRRYDCGSVSHRPLASSTHAPS